MTTLTIKNLPAGLHERLKLSAARHRRSLNREIVVCLERALDAGAPEPEDLLARIRPLREAYDGAPLDDRFLLAAREEGRP